MAINPLVYPWILICTVGATAAMLCLLDALDLRKWQKTHRINGLNGLLASSHVRTAGLLTIAMIALLGIGIVGLSPGRVPSWIPIFFLFVAASALCCVVVMDLRDRRKIAGYSG